VAVINLVQQASEDVSHVAIKSIFTIGTELICYTIFRFEQSYCAIRWDNLHDG